MSRLSWGIVGDSMVNSAGPEVSAKNDEVGDISVTKLIVWA